MSLRRAFIPASEGHHEVIRGAQRFQGAVLVSIERRAQRCAARCRALAEDLQFHKHHPGTEHVNRTRGADGKVDDAARDEWPAIVDPHLHCLPIRRVLHTHHGIKRQRPMRSGHRLVRIEDLTAGRPSAVIRLRVIRREAFELAGTGRGVRM